MGGGHRKKCAPSLSTDELVSGLDLETFEIKSHNVAKLASLIDAVASGLQVAPSRVRTAAAQLRKHKLLTTGPRGPGAPEMRPEDAAYLLLALMYDAELAVAEQSAANLSAAWFVHCRHRPFGQVDDQLDDFPRNSIFGPPDRALTFGEVLATVIDWFVRYGTLEEGEDTDLDLSVLNLTFTTTSPDYSAQVHFNTHEGYWDLTYKWKSPEQLAYDAATKGNMVAKRWDARHGPYMWSSRTVGEDSLSIIADCLRGGEWDYGSDEIVPPYENAPAAENQLETA